MGHRFNKPQRVTLAETDDRVSFKTQQVHSLPRNARTGRLDTVGGASNGPATIDLAQRNSPWLCLAVFARVCRSLLRDGRAGQRHHRHDELLFARFRAVLTCRDGGQRSGRLARAGRFDLVMPPVGRTPLLSVVCWRSRGPLLGTAGLRLLGAARGVGFGRFSLGTAAVAAAGNRAGFGATRHAAQDRRRDHAGGQEHDAKFSCQR